MKAFALLAVTFVAAFSFAPAEAEPPQDSCPIVTLGVPTYISSQSWWTAQPGTSSTDFGHLHAEGCIPERGFILRDTPFRMKVVMHDNPSVIKIHASVVTKGKSYETTVQKLTDHIGMTCPAGTCEQWLDFSLRPDMFCSDWDFEAQVCRVKSTNGLQEVRYRVFADTPDGNRMTASLNYQVYVWDRQTRLLDWEFVNRMPYLRMKGWYGEQAPAHYCEADFLSVPIRPHVLKPTVQVLNHDDSAPVSRYSVHLDPDFHHGHEGTVLLSGTGQLQPTQITLPALSPGMHRIAVKADCDFEESTNSGLGVIFFRVQH